MKKKVNHEFNVLAGLFILIGVLLILENNGILPGIHKFWPALLSLLGIGMTLLFFSDKKDVGLLWFGSFMLMLSIFFFYLNFNSWSALKSLWPIFITILGVSAFICYFPNKNRVLLFLGLFGIMLSAAFILIFSVSESLWPVSLIVTGLFIYIVSFFGKK
jgi:hypothetical protein